MESYNYSRDFLPITAYLNVIMTTFRSKYRKMREGFIKTQAQYRMKKQRQEYLQVRLFNALQHFTFRMLRYTFKYFTFHSEEA